MAAVDIVFEMPEGQLLAFLADAVLSETHRISALATEHEVESGVDVTDHYRAERAPLDLRVAISDSPTQSIEGDSETFFFGVSGAEEPQELTPDGVAPFRVSTFQADGQEITRTVDNWAVLEQARDQGMLATIRTPLRSYTDMVLISAETTRDSRRGRMIVADLTFVPIRQVATELVDVADPVRPRDVPGVNDGAQGSDDAEDEPQTSLLLQNLRAIFG